MSVLTILIAFLLFAIQPIGLFMFLLGVTLFLLAPLVHRLTGEARQLADLHLWLAMWATGRAALVVTAHDELLFKRMTFVDAGVEEISFSDTTKEFEDPATALHYFKNVPFAFADEVHGILFDPWHAAIGKRKQTAIEQDDMIAPATPGERSQYDVLGWIKGVFEFPEATHELVNLSAARNIITGSERAEHPERVETWYEYSRDPYEDGPATSRVAILIAATIGPFAAIWLIASQGGGSGGGSTISYGLLAVLASLAPLHELAKEVLPTTEDGDIDRRSTAVWTALLGAGPLFLLVLLVLTGPLVAIGSAILIAAGLLALPALTFFARMIGPIGGALARYLYLRTGLLGFDQPVLEWTPRRYRIREYDDLHAVDDERVHWYGLAGSLLGVTFDPSPDAWGEAAYRESDIDPRLEHVTDVKTDGGATSNIPVGYTPFPHQRRAAYGGFVPSSNMLSAREFYVDSGIALSEFTDASVGHRSMKKLQEAKEEHGGQSNMNERAFMLLTAGLSVVSFAAGIGVFLL